MNEDQMKELTKAAQLLRQAKARIDAVREAVDKEREGLPERLHSTEIERTTPKWRASCWMKPRQTSRMRWPALPRSPERMI